MASQPGASSGARPDWPLRTPAGHPIPGTDSVLLDPAGNIVRITQG